MENQTPVISILNLHTMTSQQVLQSDFLDILFEKRNKLYGAYLLRREYNSNLLKAIAGTSVLAIGLLFLTGSPGENAKPQKPGDKIILTTIVLPAEKKIELPKPKIQPPPATTAQPMKMEVLINRMKIVDDPVVPVATTKNLEDVLVGNTKGYGVPSDFPTPPQLPASHGDGKGEDKTERTETPLPNRAPQFPGGTEAWLNFLNRNLHPPTDLEPGEKRLSLIRFSVDEEGIVTNFHIVQSGGREFDNEVIRVLKKMPKWTPALQSGKPIAVSFTQPVSFVAPDE